MKRTGLFLVALVLALPSGEAASPDSLWDLQSCIEEAVGGSPRLAAKHAGLEVARAKLAESEVKLYPVIGAKGSYSFISETMELQLPQTGPFSPPEIEFGDGTNAEIQLAVEAPLYTGGMLRNRIGAERFSVRAAEIETGIDSLDLVLEIRKAYFGILGLESMVSAAESGRERIRRHFANLQAASDTGMADEEALLLVQARVKKASQQTVELEAGLHSARLALGRLLNRPGEAVQVAGDLDSSLLVDSPREPLESRAEVKMVEAQIQRTDRLAAAAGGSYLPSLAAVGAYHYGRPGVDMIANEWMDYGTVAVQLRWTLWDWGARKRRVQQATASERMLKEHKRELSQGLQTRLEITAAMLESRREACEIVYERLDMERKRLVLVTGRYRRGMCSETELLDTHDEVTAAQADYALAKSELRKAEAEYLRAIGR